MAHVVQPCPTSVYLESCSHRDSVGMTGAGDPPAELAPHCGPHGVAHPAVWILYRLQVFLVRPRLIQHANGQKSEAGVRPILKP